MPSLLRDLWSEARAAAAGVIFDDACALCQVPGVAGVLPALCGSCAKALPRLEEPRCGLCGEWFVGTIPGPFRCTNCAGRRFAFDFAIAPFKARAGVRELVHRFKYQRQLWLSETLGALLAEALRGPRADPRLAADGGWLLVPVPLHPRRLREREFNQALELAAVAGRLTGHPVADVLRRTRYTTGQASLTRKDRLDNLRGAFRLQRAWPWRSGGRAAVAGRSVLLLDDVFTTGATTHECARVLRKFGGAKRVVALTLARG